ncbi:MAG: zf-HC2 domain-containing protein [Phycisphaerales bacterium]|nr:MAG: zf-HC2 domain-containing protein [Phycisphaerales bacterium]
MNEECERMKDKMADHLFDGLGAQDREALNKHLAGCSKCAEHFQKLGDERALLREFSEKVGAETQRRKEAMAEVIKRCDLSKRARITSGWGAIVLSPAAKLAAAAVLLIAVGFAAGRLMPGRSVDIDELRVALEGSMKSSLEEGIQNKLIERVNLDREAALDRHYARLKDEFARQSRREMSELAEMTLAASQAATEERLAELVRLIEAARLADHWQIRRALKQTEANRLQDWTRFGESLINLVPFKEE